MLPIWVWWYAAKCLEINGDDNIFPHLLKMPV